MKRKKGRRKGRKSGVNPRVRPATVKRPRGGTIL